MKDNRQFIHLVTDFVAADNRAMQPVREIEGEFAELYDDDERFEDLQYVLAMYDGSEENHKRLMSECRWALRELTKTGSQQPGA